MMRQASKRSPSRKKSRSVRSISSSVIDLYNSPLTDKPLSSLKFEIKTSEVGLFLHFLFTPNRVIEWGELLKFTISIQQGGRVCSTIWLRLVISRSLQSIRVGLLLHFPTCEMTLSRHSMTIS